MNEHDLILLDSEQQEIEKWVDKDLTEQCNIPDVSKRYYHEVCGKGTLIKEYEHSVYGTMLMVKPLNKKDIYFAPKREFTELPFS